MADPSRAVARDPQPAFPLRLFRVDPGKSVIVRWLSNWHRGLFCHWNAGRSVYCDPRGCSPSVHRSPRLYKGYESAEIWDPARLAWLPVVFEVSESLDLDLAEIELRGSIWKVSRQSQSRGPKTPVVGHWIEEVDPAALPAPFDLTAVLRHVYHVDVIRLEATNPLPARQMVVYSEGSPPICELANVARAEQLRAANERMRVVPRGASESDPKGQSDNPGNHATANGKAGAK